MIVDMRLFSNAMRQLIRIICHVLITVKMYYHAVIHALYIVPMKVNVNAMQLTISNAQYAKKIFPLNVALRSFPIINVPIFCHVVINARVNALIAIEMAITKPAKKNVVLFSHVAIRSAERNVVIPKKKSISIFYAMIVHLRRKILSKRHTNVKNVKLCVK